MELGKYKIVLGSQSPRRSQLLKSLDIEFVVRAIEIEESFPDDLATEKVAEYIAVKKAEAHGNTILNDEIIITADTVVAHKNQIYGKPASKKDAIETLLLLSEDIHAVYTGVCIMDSKSTSTFTSKSKVKFAKISEDEAHYYYDRYRPDDKAGSYGIQEWIGASKVEWIEGAYNNIIGLPTAELYAALKSFIK